MVHQFCRISRGLHLRVDAYGSWEPLASEYHLDLWRDRGL
jgi:hypothetical protein